MVFGTKVLKYWVLGPSGECKDRIPCYSNLGKLSPDGACIVLLDMKFVGVSQLPGPPKSPKQWTLYCLYSLFWDIGPSFWALSRSRYFVEDIEMWSLVSRTVISYDPSTAVGYSTPPKPKKGSIIQPTITLWYGPLIFNPFIPAPYHTPKQRPMFQCPHKVH